MTTTVKKSKTGKTAFDFEQAMQKLKQIQTSLEEGDLPLEKAIEQFEQGSALVKECRKALEEAEQRVKILDQDNAALERFAAEDE